jgi:NSS family neurotransmitter:Na+ symporter
VKRSRVNIGVALIAFLAGLIYTTQAGLYWLDIVDYFMNNFGLFVVGGLECIALAWFYSAPKLRGYANQRSELKLGRWWDALVRYFIPAVCGLILLAAIIDRVRAPYGGYERAAEVLGGWAVIGGFLIIAFIISRFRGRKEG